MIILKYNTFGYITRLTKVKKKVLIMKEIITVCVLYKMSRETGEKAFIFWLSNMLLSKILELSM